MGTGGHRPDEEVRCPAARLVPQTVPLPGTLHEAIERPSYGLNAERVRTARSGIKWHGSTVKAVLASLDLDAKSQPEDTIQDDQGRGGRVLLCARNGPAKVASHLWSWTSVSSKSTGGRIYCLTSLFRRTLLHFHNERQRSASLSHLSRTLIQARSRLSPRRDDGNSTSSTCTLMKEELQ